MTEAIPFNVPSLEGRELEYVQQAVLSSRTSSGGPFTARATEILSAEAGGAEALLTTSCTAALEMSALLLDLQPDDTVIVPSFTFTTSALAFAREGARLLFCDIEPTTLGPDPAHVAELLADPEIGPTVRAVVIVHYAGVAGDVDGLRAVLADRPDVVLIEDAAHGLFGRWRGLPLGTLGRFATLSFHETKNFYCGEGGALLLNDPDDVARAWVIYEKGTNRKAFFQGEVDKYSWRDTGSSFGMADILAAFLLGQLEQREAIQAKRKAVYDGYHERLSPVADELGLVLPTVPEHCEAAYHLFHLLLPDHDTRTRVIAELKGQEIHTTFHYVPLHDSIAGNRFAAKPTHCPVTTDVSSRLLRLPFHNQVTPDQQDRVVEALTASLRTTEAAR